MPYSQQGQGLGAAITREDGSLTQATQDFSESIALQGRRARWGKRGKGICWFSEQGRPGKDTHSGSALKRELYLSGFKKGIQFCYVKGDCRVGEHSTSLPPHTTHHTPHPIPHTPCRNHTISHTPHHSHHSIPYTPQHSTAHHT